MSMHPNVQFRVNSREFEGRGEDNEQSKDSLLPYYRGDYYGSFLINTIRACRIELDSCAIVSSGMSAQIPPGYLFRFVPIGIDLSGKQEQRIMHNARSPDEWVDLDLLIDNTFRLGSISGVPRVCALDEKEAFMELFVEKIAPEVFPIADCTTVEMKEEIRKHAIQKESREDKHWETYGTDDSYREAFDKETQVKQNAENADSALFLATLKVHQMANKHAYELTNTSKRKVDAMEYQREFCGFFTDNMPSKERQELIQLENAITRWFQYKKVCRAPSVPMKGFDEQQCLKDFLAYAKTDDWYSRYREDPPKNVYVVHLLDGHWTCERDESKVTDLFSKQHPVLISRYFLAREGNEWVRIKQMKSLIAVARQMSVQQNV